MRGRFAPSPTGELHLGSARTALLAWLQVRAAGGQFVMRIEDLDRSRVRTGMMQTQLEELHWLGLDWDEGPDVGGSCGPYLQSERAERYEAALRRLADGGHLFACRCSRRDLAAAASAPHAGEEGPRYPGTCREARLPARGAGQEKAAALRFRVAAGEVCFHDLLHGRVCFDPARETGDFVVRRKDAVPAYQLAVVVDDAAMAITHVLRGADLLSSTARQILLYRALDLEPPRWTHVPLVLAAGGDRLAKRHRPLSLRQLRQARARPEALVGWLAASCGLAEPGEEISPRELIGRFSLQRLPREPTVLPLSTPAPAAPPPSPAAS